MNRLYDKQSIVVQLLSCVLLFATPWTAAWQASLSFNIFWSFLKLMSIESVMPSNRFILHHSLLLLPSIVPKIRVFSNELAVCIMWPRVFGASASASVLLMSIQGWFPLGLIGVISLQSEGTLKSLLQHYSLKASILWHSAFFIIQYSHPYMTTGKIIALICGPLLAK